MNEWPSDYWKLGALLLHQQCWQWGRDIRSPHGNLLLAAGFERTRPPAGLPAGSRYVRLETGAPVIYLWAFGLFAFLPEEGGIYINRYCFVPRWVPEAEAALAPWKPEVFEGCGPALTHRQIRTSKFLLRYVLTAMAEYEEDIVARHGIAYRRESLREWHEPAILPERMPIEWRRMGWHVPEPPIRLTAADASTAACAGGRAASERRTMHF